MDNDIIAIRDLFILAQSDLSVAVSGVNGLAGRDYEDVQLAIFRRGLGDAMSKLQTALSKINEKSV